LQNTIPQLEEAMTDFERRLKISAKNKRAAFFLCLFLGVLGTHKFYEGKILLGILCICTGGLLGIGIIFDLISMFFKPNPYYP
jgi:hypothetical protein